MEQQFKTAICIIIKNEQEYLKEWIDYHLNLGFTDIHIYEDRGSTSHADIIKDYPNVLLHTTEDKEINRILSIEGSARQKSLYDYFCIAYKSKYDRVAFIDIDEFITFADGYNLEMLCNEFEDDTAVLLNWKMIGASGYISKPELPTVEAYTVEGKFLPGDTGWAYKSFVNLQKYTTMKNLHFADGAVNTDHKESILDLKYDKVWINHYFTKSWEDWCNRIFKRGGTLNGHRTLDQFFIVNPDMAALRTELLLSVIDYNPIGSMWISKEEKIMKGGNIRKLNRLNESLGISHDDQIRYNIEPKPIPFEIQRVTELKQKISFLKAKIAKSDYQALKYVDGLNGGELYEMPPEVIMERQDVRNLINQYEVEIIQLQTPAVTPSSTEVKDTL